MPEHQQNKQQAIPVLSAQQNEVVALAALLQAAELVVDIAEKGRCDSYYSNALLNSLFVFDPKSTIDVYANNLQHLELGLSSLANLSKPAEGKRFNQVTRYAISLIALEKQLSRQPDMLELVRSRLNHIDFNQRHFLDDGDFAPIRSSLSGIYQDTISTLKFRIQVKGNMELLSQTHHADHIRALLFSGIRAAMLWRQLDCNRWQLIFKRRKIEEQAQILIELGKQN